VQYRCILLILCFKLGLLLCIIEKTDFSGDFEQRRFTTNCRLVAKNRVGFVENRHHDAGQGAKIWPEDYASSPTVLGTR